MSGKVIPITYLGTGSIVRFTKRSGEYCGGLSIGTRALLRLTGSIKVEDYYPSGKRFLLRFKEKGGKEKELPV
jgi:hypothetical protein